MGASPPQVPSPSHLTGVAGGLQRGRVPPASRGRQSSGPGPNRAELPTSYLLPHLAKGPPSPRKSEKIAPQIGESEPPDWVCQGAAKGPARPRHGGASCPATHGQVVGAVGLGLFRAAGFSVFWARVTETWPAGQSSLLPPQPRPLPSAERTQGPGHLCVAWLREAAPPQQPEPGWAGQGSKAEGSPSALSPCSPAPGLGSAGAAD